jgi:putative transcriptional regulator
MPGSGSPAASLVGRFLVAAPSMPDERFQKSVVFICKHDDDGALGIIVNNKVEDLPLGQVYKQLGIEVSAAAAERPVLFGGPVETSRGLVLHSDDYKRDETLPIDGGMALTASLEILKDMASGSGPKQAWLALGARPARPRDAGQCLAGGRRRCRPGVRPRFRRQMAARAGPAERRPQGPV